VSCTDTPAGPFCCGDGVCDPTEDSCQCLADCGPPPPNEDACVDGLDNDCDGLADAADDDCIQIQDVLFPNGDWVTMEWSTGPVAGGSHFEQVNDFTDDDSSYVQATVGAATFVRRFDTYQLDPPVNMPDSAGTDGIVVEVVARSSDAKGPDEMVLGAAITIAGFQRDFTYVSIPNDPTYQTYTLTNPDWNHAWAKSFVDDMRVTLVAEVTRGGRTHDVGIRVSSVRVTVSGFVP
jgi:hypothetical protein